MITRSRAGITKPKTPYVGVIEVKHAAQSDVEPKSVTKALSSPKWKQAMVDEFAALQHNKTWSLVPYNDSQKLVDCKWVFKTKFKADGSLLKHKARLVAKGFQQIEGVDYSETFSPVIKPITI